MNPLFLRNNSEWRIAIECGNHKLHEEKITNSSSAFELGVSFQFEARFPSESQLTISLKSKNSEIAETRIDLEDRFYATCYATCGLPARFDLDGYNAWRDVLYPSQILEKKCEKFNLSLPKFEETNELVKLKIFSKSNILLFKEERKVLKNSRNKNEKTDEETERLLDDNESEINNAWVVKQQLALNALNSWQSLTKVKLVPEHVESRYLYNREINELEQGKIQMWIDMFSMDEGNPEAKVNLLDIRFKKPRKYQLRVIVYSTSDVTLDDYNPVTHERSSDIYIKGYLKAFRNKSQKTDTHYNSLTGRGNFNWRFKFDFDFLSSENLIVYEGFRGKEYKAEPVLVLECYDEDKFSGDDLLGSMEIDLTRVMPGSRTAKECSVNMLTRKTIKRMNLFKNNQHETGWYPLISENQLGVFINNEFKF